MSNLAPGRPPQSAFAASADDLSTISCRPSVLRGGDHAEEG
jgi:hypothetical protein